MVFDRYSEGGGEMLLALALADHAHDDGTHIFPSVARLAAKTRQSTRSVQYQLRRMEASGWLILVNSGSGGRQSGYKEGGKTREYRINPDWMKGADIAPLQKCLDSQEKGAEIAPFDSPKGAIDDNQGCKTAQERVQNGVEKGAKLLHPNQEQPKATISKSNHQRQRASAPPVADLDFSSWPSEPSPQVLADWLHMRRKRRADVTATVLKTFGGELHRAAAMGFTVDDCLAKCCARNWQGFEAGWLTRNTADHPATSGESHAARPPGRKLSAADRVAQNVFNAQHHDADDPGDAIPGEAVRLAS